MLNFYLNDKQIKMFEEWKNLQEFKDPNYEFRFRINNGIGISCEVIELNSDNKIDITDYASW
jgi:hypothetical protein